MSDLMTVPEAMAHLHVGRTTAWKEVASGRLPTVRIGRKRLVRDIDLAAYIEARVTGDRMDEGAAPGQIPEAARRAGGEGARTRG